MSDPFADKMIVDGNDNAAIDDDDSGESTRTRKKRTRSGDESGDQSMREPKRVTYTPDLPPQVASNPVLSLLSTPALKELSEVATDIWINMRIETEDPEYAKMVEEDFRKYGIPSVNLTQHFAQGQIPRAQGIDVSGLGLNLGANTAYISEDSVSTRLAKFYKQEIGEGDNTRTGFFGDKGVIEGGTQNFSRIMDVEVGSLFAHAIIAYLKENRKKITEVQVMMLPDRIFLSTNETGALAELVNKKLSAVLDVTRNYKMAPSGLPMQDGLTKKPIPLVDDERQERVNIIKDLTKVLAGSDPPDYLQDYLTNLLVSAMQYPEQADAIVSAFRVLDPNKVFVDARGSSDLSAYITGGFANQMMLVDSGANCHAEQNLMVGMAKANYTGEATISGAKRPCSTCSLAFILMTECKNPNIVWYDRPGGAWSGSTKKSFAALLNDLKVSLDDAAKIAKKLLVDLGQFATAYDSDAPDLAMATGFGKAVTKTPKKGEEIAYADRMPQSRGLPDEVYDEVAPYSPGSPGSEYSQSSQSSQDDVEMSDGEAELGGLKKDQELTTDQVLTNLGAFQPDQDKDDV